MISYLNHVKEEINEIKELEIQHEKNRHITHTRIIKFFFRLMAFVLVVLSISMLFSSCTPTHRVCAFTTTDIGKEVHLVCNSDFEAEWLQNRLSKKCVKPYRNGSYLCLRKCHLEATNIWGQSYIRPIYYETQIEKQVECIIIKK